MINYNNNKEQTSQKVEILQNLHPHPGKKPSSFQQIDSVDPPEQQGYHPTANFAPDSKTNFQKKQESMHNNDRKVQKSKNQSDLLQQNANKQFQKEQQKYQNYEKKEGQTSKDRLNSKINVNLNQPAQINEDITVSHHSQQSINQSNNSSDTYSIHSGDKYWREQIYKEKIKRQANLKKVIPQGKTQNIQKKDLRLDEWQHEKEKNGFKYLFHQQVEENLLQQASQNKNTNENRPKKLQLRSQNKISQNVAANLPREAKIEYAYQRGKHKEGETKQQRVKNKLGFILDHLQQSNQLVSVSYYSEKHSMQKNQIKQQIQKEEIKQQIQTSKIQKVQENVIFGEEPRQLSQRQPEKQEQQQRQVIKKQIFQEIQLQRQVDPVKETSELALTPKQTIDLDKSFKSKISKITPKSKALSQSLDKSRSQVASRKTPIQRRRKNSLQQLNQIIADIEKKSEQFKSAVGESVRSKNKSQAISQAQSIKFQNNYQINSARQNYAENANVKIEKSNKEQSHEEVHRYSEHSNSKNENPKSSSSLSANISHIQMRKNPQKQIILNNQKSKKESSQPNKNTIQQFEQIDFHQQQVSSKRDSKKSQSNHDSSSIHQENVFSPLFKKDNLQEFNQEGEELKDRAKTKQNKPIKQNKLGGYMKTLVRQDIDQSDLVTQYLPKTKVQFKIDFNKRFNTETSSLASENKKYQILIKRRQEALVKKAKEQRKIDPKSFIFPQSSSGISKQSSMKSNKQSLSDVKLQPLTSRNVKNQNKIKLTTDSSFKKDTLYFETGLFPILNAKTQRQRQESKTIFVSSKNNQFGDSRKRADISGQKSTFFKEQTEKALSKPPTVKIEFRNLLKNNNPTISQKALQGKEKYDRLKKLLNNQ